jgi:adenine-specific DNA-methyltransferase
VTLINAPPESIVAKDLGAFYTPSEVATFLVRWAIRSGDDTILDPSFGAGVFLHAAAERIRSLGGKVARSVFGVEMDADSYRAALDHLLSMGVSLEHLQCNDFFSACVNHRKSQIDAVVGNPPFIRYQQFDGVVRDRAAALMRREGVRVTELASSWAPFVVAGASLLRPGGRLAMVVPMELCHASYALPVLTYLSRSFKLVQFLSFGERIFPQLSQDTLLLLADSRGPFEAEFRWKHFSDTSALTGLSRGRAEIPRAIRLNAPAISSGRERLIEQFLPRKSRELYDELRKHPSIRPLGMVADVGIGYVTGSNDFFHPTEQDVRKWDLPPAFLRRAVCRGRALTGLQFRDSDWAAGLVTGSAGYLLQVPAHGPLPPSVRQYIMDGEKAGIDRAYKCRVRKPWYTVPHVHKADALLTYMSGVSPKLVANDAGAVAPNTLHVVRMLPLSGYTPHALAVGWHSSLTRLSVEIQGHAMGGGLLKLEPLEAGRVLLALPSSESPKDLCDSLDIIARHATPDTVRLTVDRMTLRDQVGLTEADCRLLDQAAQLLRDRRLGRGPELKRMRI